LVSGIDFDTPVEAYLKAIKLLCLINILFGSITSGSIWAWGGYDRGHHFGGKLYFGGGHHHYGGSHFGGYQHYGRQHYFGGLHYGDHSFRRALGSGYDRYSPYDGRYYSPYYGVYGLGYGGGYPPLVHIQQENSAVATESQVNDWHDWNEWHWCGNPEGYYPYVKKCLNDWIPVAPQPMATKE
jgi:hypothetical protein